MTDQPVINLLSDILAVLDTDQAALEAEQATLLGERAALQEQLTAIQSQMDSNVEKLADIGRFRSLESSIEDGSAPGSMVAPGSVALPPSNNPLTPGIIES